MNIFVLYPVIKRTLVILKVGLLDRKYGAYTFRMGLEPQADELLGLFSALLCRDLRQYNKTWQLMSFLEFQRALGAVMFLSEMRAKKAR